MSGEAVLGLLLVLGILALGVGFCMLLGGVVLWVIVEIFGVGTFIWFPHSFILGLAILVLATVVSR